MSSLQSIKALLCFPFFLSLCCCVPDVILRGDISGTVIDAETTEPLQAVSIQLNPSNATVDTTSTGNDGSFLLKNLTPGSHEIQVKKQAYSKITESVTVNPGTTTEMNFELSKEPFGEYSSTYLDFGAESTEKSFTISNIGSGELRYSLSSTQGWITIDPNQGEVTTETDTIKVSIDRSGFSTGTQKEKINIISYGAENQAEDQVDVFVNGVLDQDGYYYSIVAIGTQTWMAQNLNRGIVINLLISKQEPQNNGIIEKYCYDDEVANCDIYGGLYSWNEVMDYYPEDTGTIGNTQGICPDGWHVPTYKEWITLAEFLGGYYLGHNVYSEVGGKLKDTGTIEDEDGLWLAPNEGATNETGFKALPGGWSHWDWDWEPEPPGYFLKGERAEFYNAHDGGIVTMVFHNGNLIVTPGDLGYDNLSGGSVRCIKDPE